MQGTRHRSRHRYVGKRHCDYCDCKLGPEQSTARNWHRWSWIAALMSSCRREVEDRRHTACAPRGSQAPEGLGRIVPLVE
jgi:hypothetical protein